MTQKERVEFISIIDDIQESNDKIDALERLYMTVKRIVNYENNGNN